VINIQLLREDPGKFKKAVKDKQMDPSLVDKLLEIDERRRKLIGEIETLRAERNEIAKSKNIVAGKQVKEELKKKEPELDKAEKNYFNALNLIPNPALDMVPVGKDEKDNVEVRKWGEPKKFNFAPKDRWLAVLLFIRRRGFNGTCINSLRL